MKRIITVFTSMGLLIAFQSATWAQSITINSVSGTQFCAGDPISVTFTVTGTWEHNNAFTAQLSDATGSFKGTFTYLGSVIDTIAGTFTVVGAIPLKAYYSDHYRVRVIGAYPYIVSTDNGSNLLIGEFPMSYNWDQYWVGAVVVGLPHEFTLNNMGDRANSQSDSVFVDFGEGANPRTLTYWGENPAIYSTVTYSSSGLKTLVSRTVSQGGCSVSDTTQSFAFDCTSPVIPHDAIVVSINKTGAATNKTYWVNPGVSFNAATSDTIFAETGASITGYPSTDPQSNNIVYLKPGATSNGDGEGVVIYAPGASVDNSDQMHAPTLECTDLAFDYSQAPPNSIMHINEGEAVAPAAPLLAIEISPNPTSGEVMLNGLPANASITAMNILGETVQEMKAPAGGSATFDLSKLATGTYYIRIASGGSVTTKRVIKE